MKDKILKVGILKDTYETYGDDGFVIVVRTRELGSQRMTLRKSEFYEAWYSPRKTVRKTDCPFNTYHNIGEMLHLPYPFDIALNEYKIRPTNILRHCGLKARKKIEWVARRRPKGGDNRHACD